MDPACVCVFLIHRGKFTSGTPRLLMKLILWCVLATLLDNTGLFHPLPPPDWGYHMRVSGNAVHNNYSFHEIRPWSAMHCPKEYYIAQVRYHFRQPTAPGTPHHETIRTPLVSLDFSDLKMQNFTYFMRYSRNVTPYEKYFDNHDEAVSEVGQCPTLCLCLGYQACLFHYSNDLCLSDPMPGARKILQVEIACHQDTLYPVTSHDNFQHLNQYVVFIQSENNKKIVSDLSEVKVKVTQTDEHEVFNVGCPSLREAKQIGYSGNCSEEATSDDSVQKRLWTVLGRESTRLCREKLIEVFCAYQYNRYGQCVPPFLLSNSQDDSGLLHFTHDALPVRRNFPDLSNYQRIFWDPNIGLIPVRFGFLIIAHKDPTALIELLQLIYEPQHHYVFHIDRRSSVVRQELIEKIAETFPGQHNIRVIPESRSFAAGWGSYEILRSMLEGYSELLDMGIWDFAVVLSGADLPLRSIPDLALTFAPYRGRNFIRINTFNFSQDVGAETGWLSCNGHTYNVTSRKRWAYNMYSSSAWAIFSREFTQYFVSPERRREYQHLHFFLQTTFIPDETYLGTLLHSSPFRNTITRGILHYQKHFFGNDENNLCRHSRETDSCGQGPSEFELSDEAGLIANRDVFFFARKFNSDPTNPIRNRVISALKDDSYQEHLRHLVSDTEIEVMASMALPQLSQRFGQLVLLNVISWRAVPHFLTSQPCCTPAVDNGVGLSNEFMLWIHMNVRTENGQIHEARAVFAPRPSHSCYPSGHIRLLQLTTRTEPPPQPPAQHSPSGWKSNVPSATNPAGGDILWIHVYLHQGRLISKCQEELRTHNMQRRTFATLRDTEPLDAEKKMVLDVLLTSPSGDTRCRDHITLTSQLKLDVQESMDLQWLPLRCGVLEPGEWTVTLKQVDVDAPYVYKQQVYLSDPQVGPPKEAVPFLWRLQTVGLIDHEQFAQYYKHQHPRNKKSKSSRNKEPLVNADASILLRNREYHYAADMDTRIPNVTVYYSVTAASLFASVIIFYWCFFPKQPITGILRYAYRQQTVLTIFILMVLFHIILYIWIG